jgi:hypothetical protein
MLLQMPGTSFPQLTTLGTQPASGMFSHKGSAQHLRNSSPHRPATTLSQASLMGTQLDVQRPSMQHCWLAPQIPLAVVEHGSMASTHRPPSEAQEAEVQHTSSLSHTPGMGDWQLTGPRTCCPSWAWLRTVRQRSS